MGKSKSVTVGYRYLFGIQMGLCRGPVNEIVEIRVGERTAWAGNELDKNAEINIDAAELFGGEKGEGGVQGTFSLFMGANTQTSIPPLEAMVGGPRPGYRHRVTAFFDGIVTMINPYPKPWAFRIRRTTAGWDGEPWYPAKATIVMTRPVTEGEVTSRPDIHAMNPAHIIYECLTNRDWGGGFPPERLDAASFAAAADALYDEEFGLCTRWVRRDTLTSFVRGILDHIAGALYNDPTTGLLVLKLIRDDYVRDAVPLFDADSGLLSIEDCPVAALGPGVNEMVVTYRDPINNKDLQVTVQNLASIQAANGTFNSRKKTFSAIPTPELALRVAQRELRTTSGGIRLFRVRLDRRAWSLAPAGVFRVRDESRGVKDVVLRIAQIDRGRLTDGTITIDAVSDIFSFPRNSYIAPQYPPDRVRPTPMPTESVAFEAPYYYLAGTTPAADFAHIGLTDGYIASLALQPTPVHGGYELAVRDGLPTQDDYPV